MKEAILVFDVGTTNFKTVLFAADGTIAYTQPVPFRPAYGSEGMVFQDPSDWRDAVLAGAAAAAAFARSHGLAIAGLSLTASRSSVIPVDGDGGHIGPAMMWQETASRDIVNRCCRDGMLERIYDRTGSRPNTVYSAPKMTWLRHNRPKIYARAAKLVGIQDYIVRLLTGEFVTDHTFGSRTLLMNIRTREWDDEMLDLFEVERSKLCRLITPGSLAGGLTAKVAAATGLPAGLPVVSAGGDQNNAALGAGVFRRGDVMVNLGTGSFMVAAVDEPVSDPAMRVMCNASAVPGKWIIDAGMLTTGSVHRWLVENFYCEFTDEQAKARYDHADVEAEQAEPGCGGLLVLPHFAGRGAPHWDNNAEGAIYGLGLGHRRRDIARAVYEGIAGEIAANLAVADELIGATRIRLAGGLSQSRFFDQLLADVCQRPLRLSTAREATAHGAWIQAMVALGRAESREALLLGDGEDDADEFTPDPRLADCYRRFLRRREALFSHLTAMHGDRFCGE